MIKKLIKHSNVASKNEIQPFGSLQNEINRLFDDFFAPFPSFGSFPSFSHKVESFYPRLDVIDNKTSYDVKADLPGISEKDILLEIHDGVLTLKGEQKEEIENKDKDYYVCERRYGSFHRSISLSNDIDESKIDASFKDGVLTVHLPKKKEAQKEVKKIEVKKG